MSKTGMNRRQFLETGSRAAAGVTAVVSGGMLMAPDGAWAMQMSGALDAHTVQSLIKMTRGLYPHNRLGDMYYARVVEDLDSAAGSDPELAAMLTEGVAALDGVYGVAFVDLSEGYQEKVLLALQGTPFFEKVRSTTVVALYNNPLVWRQFGYEGESYSYGGYIDRGFDDLAWLPNPPAAASPSKA